MTAPTSRDWEAYPVRVCRTMHACVLCPRRIGIGDAYRDGGYGRRAHVECVQAQKQERSS